MKKSIKVLKKKNAATLIPLLITSSMTMAISTDVIAGPKGQGLECAFFDGSWKHIRGEIYSCRYRYQHYSVFDFKNSTVRHCEAGNCNKIAIHNSDNGNPKSEK